MRFPWRANAGSAAVTLTAATFLIWSCRGLMLSVSPRRRSMFSTLCTVKMACWLSPVPLRPATSPYPDSWFCRTPSIEAMSFSRAPNAGAANVVETMAASAASERK